MSETKFTKGEWGTNVATKKNGDGCVFVSEAFNLIAVLDFKKSSKSNAISNAHLIAAAPEMYAMLERLKTGLQNLIEFDYVPYRMHDKTNEIINEVENLLAKARGK